MSGTAQVLPHMDFPYIHRDDLARPNSPVLRRYFLDVFDSDDAMASLLGSTMIHPLGYAYFFLGDGIQYNIHFQAGDSHAHAHPRDIVTSHKLPDGAVKHESFGSLVSGDLSSAQARELGAQRVGAVANFTGTSTEQTPKYHAWLNLGYAYAVFNARTQSVAAGTTEMLARVNHRFSIQYLPPHKVAGSVVIKTGRLEPLSLSDFNGLVTHKGLSLSAAEKCVALAAELAGDSKTDPGIRTTLMLMSPAELDAMPSVNGDDSLLPRTPQKLDAQMAEYLLLKLLDLIIGKPNFSNRMFVPSNPRVLDGSLTVDRAAKSAQDRFVGPRPIF